MTSPISTRLFIEGLDITPDNQVLVFSNATDVGNYYGSHSSEYAMAQTYFTGPYASSATMEFVRDSNGQRPHLIAGLLHVSKEFVEEFFAPCGELHLAGQGPVVGVRG
jgi:hypothetical protein